MTIKSIKIAKGVNGLKVLIRADFNVPIRNGKILDSYKIDQGLGTIKYLIKKKCKIIITTHLGRPSGFEKKYSLKPIADFLTVALGQRVGLSSSIVGLRTSSMLSKLRIGEIMMLENLRFDDREKKNDKKFARMLAGLADIYVNDSFAVNHRKAASVDAIKGYIDSYAGLQLEREVVNLYKIAKPKKPLVVVLGGAKANTKIPLIKKFSRKAEWILVGGALANNFLKARGYKIGASLTDPTSIFFAKEFQSKKLLLPVDVVKRNVVSKNVSVCSVNMVGDNDVILDIGPKTVELFASFIKKANSIVWNGPMGMFESKQFKHGSMAIAQVVASRSKGRAFGVVGGGETVEVLKLVKMDNYVDWVSTGGGAMLTFLGGGEMPGIKNLISYK